MSARKNLLFIASLLACTFAAATAYAADKAAAGKRPIPVAIGYLNAAKVSCSWAGHCRDDLGPVESEYMKYLDESEKVAKDCVSQGGSAEEIQNKVNDYRAGLQARETLYGRCPGRCLSYDFPVDFRNSSRLIARNKRLDLLIDLGAIYYGADIVMKGPDVSDETLADLKKTAR